MNLQEIKDAVDAGKVVHWNNDGYTVKLWAAGYFIVCESNQNATRLTWADGVTMNEKEEDFYIGETVCTS